MAEPSSRARHQTLVGAGVLVVGAGLAWGATSISSKSGYSGVGPNFLAWLVSIALIVCGAWLLYEARSGGFRDMEEPSGGAQGDWPAFLWISVGVLANATLITRIGFILSCTLCFMLAVRGLRISDGKPAGNVRHSVLDFATGFMIAAPAYWLFTKLLSINHNPYFAVA